MKCEALGGLRKRNGVLERRASCVREGGGGRGTLSRPIRNALAYPSMGRGGWWEGWARGAGREGGVRGEGVIPCGRVCRRIIKEVHIPPGSVRGSGQSETESERVESPNPTRPIFQVKTGSGNMTMSAPLPAVKPKPRVGP